MDNNFFILVIKIYVVWILIETIFFKKIKVIFMFLIFIFKRIFFVTNYFFKFIFFPFNLYLLKLIFKNKYKTRQDETDDNLKDSFPQLIFVDDDLFEYSYVKKIKLTSKVYYNCSKRSICEKKCLFLAPKNDDTIYLYVSKNNHNHQMN